MKTTNICKTKANETKALFRLPSDQEMDWTHPSVPMASMG